MDITYVSIFLPPQKKKKYEELCGEVKERNKIITRGKENRETKKTKKRKE